MRAVLAALGRALLALVLLGIMGAVVAAGTQLPSPAGEAVPERAVAVPPAPTVLVCPGPLRLPTELEPGDDAAYDPQFDTAPGESVSQITAITARPGEGPASDAGLSTLGSDTVSTQVVAAGDTGVARVPQPTTALVARADAVEGVPAWLAATLHVRTESGDLRGLVSASCQRPAAQQWLVGGSTELGSSARLVLQNPGLTAAAVTVRMWGASGPVELTGGEYLVPPGSERIVLLEGLAAEQARVVVQTAAVGGLVTAYLQDSRLAGLVPAGVDDVVAGPPPATRQVVAGIALTGAEDAEAAVLRVVAPGEEGGAVSVTLLGPDGPVPLPGGSTTLAPGTVLDVPLSGIGAGDYTAVVNADVPVVAGAMVTRRSSDAGAGADAVADRAWLPATAAGAGPLALPDGVAGRLVLSVAPDGETAGRGTVVIETSDGSRVERVVAEGATLSLPLEGLGATDGVVVRTRDPRVAWAVVLEDVDMVSVLVPVPPLAAQDQVTVEVR